jgi:hypothetical protein
MNNNEEDYIDDAFDEDNFSEENDSSKMVKGRAANVGNGRMKNDLVDDEVAQVIMKSTSNMGNEKKQAAGGYAIPDSDEEVD